MTRVLIACVAAGLALTGGACGLSTPDAVVMISGRDDHGDLERPHLGLQVSPADRAVAATARDGEFAHVKERRGPWTRVAIVRTREAGWIEDHYLRGDAIWVAPNAPLRVTFAAAEARPEGVFIRVRPPDGSAERWVPASELREVGAR